MDIVERAVDSPWEGVLVQPAGGSPVGVLVLSGSSGRIETERCRLLARAGMTALSIRWFGGAGQPAGICEIPLETFTAAVDLLRAGGAERLGLIGSSKGAEAALLVAVRDPRVDAVVAQSPTSVAWANVGPGSDGATYPLRSSWTWRGEPLPFVPYDEGWTPEEAAGEPVAYRTLYERSSRAFAEAAERAAVPIERTAAEIVLIAGGDDLMWPSLPFAEDLATRRARAGSPVRLVRGADAGHRPRFPGESPAAPSALFRYGGTAAADAALGALAWPHALAALAGDALDRVP